MRRVGLPGALVSSANARDVFGGFSPKHSGPAGVLLPEKGQDRSELAYEGRRASVFAEARKGHRRLVMQDTAFVLIDERAIVAGVLDGRGTAGEKFSERVGEELLKAAEARLGGLEKPDSEEMLVAGAGKAILRMTRPPSQPESISYGGTTAVVVAIMLDDGSYSISGIGDSGAYSLVGGKATCLFPTKEFTDLMKVVPLNTVDLQHYRMNRNSLIHSISIKGIPKGCVRTERGVLAQGSMLLLATDGVLKNLAVTFNQKSMFMDNVDGCEEIEHVTSRKDSVVDAARSISRLVQRRMALPNQEPIIEGNRAILPQNDDMALVAVKRA